MSDSPGLLDFAIGLVYLVLNLSKKQVDFFGNLNYRKTVISFDHNQYHFFLGGGEGVLVKMTLGLVHASYTVQLARMASCKTVFSLHPGEGFINEKSASQHVPPYCS